MKNLTETMRSYMNMIAESTRQAAAAIAAGEIVTLVDASWSLDHAAIGHFRECGWAEKITTRSSMYWRWTGPTAIIVNGQHVEPGRYTEEVDMDWS